MAPFTAPLTLLSECLARPGEHDAYQHPTFSDRQPSMIYPLTKSQEGIFIEYTDDPMSSKYNLSLEIDLPTLELGSLIEKVTQVVHTLTDRHAILRSMIVVRDGKPHTTEFATTDIDQEVHLILAQKTEVSEATIKRNLSSAFSLTTELPVRWILVRDSTVSRLYLASHHIALDGLALSTISKEFLALLEHPDAELPPVQKVSQMHMIEQAWASSPAYQACQTVILDQMASQSRAPWPTESLVTHENTHPFGARRLDVWASYSSSELQKWSEMHKTSWFRVATSLVGLLVVDETRTPFASDEVLSVGFGSRPTELKDCVGQFANALPVKIPLWDLMRRGEDTLGALVRAVSENISAVKRAELASITETMRGLRRRGVDCSAPRVAVTIIPKLAGAGCRVFPVAGRWDLYFCFKEEAAGITLGVIYDPRIFTASALRRMKAKFDFLTDASTDEAVRLQDLVDWLPKHACLPSTPTTRPTNPCRHAHHYFDAHAETCPSSVALHSAELGLSMTYGQLYASTEEKALFLQDRGIAPGHRIIISFSRGFALIEWILAVLKCGAAFIFLDPELADGPKENILSVCEPALVLDASVLPEYSKQIGAESKRPHEDDLLTLERAKFGTSDEDTAYIIFTSGSTGTPKGVLVSHGNLAHFLQGSSVVFDCGYGSRILQLASFSFDASVLEWTTALCTGGCLCFAENPSQLVGDYLADVVDDNQITFMQITPSVLETVPDDRDLISLQQMCVGGESGSRELFAKWHPRVNLVNGYGPTEATIGVSFNRMNKAAELPDLISVGTPTPSTDIYICSDDLRVVSPGTPGEICIAGPQVAKGYLNRPEAQAQSFVCLSNGTQIYRTGDRGMIAEDGSLAVMGRLDRQLKVRGLRVSPEEIETAILQSDMGIKETSVQFSESRSELIAFIAPGGLSIQDLRRSLRNQLPAQKLPTKFVEMASLPKSISMKVDHKAVRIQAARSNDLTFADEPAVHATNGADVAQVDGINGADVNSEDNERTISQLWSEVIGLSKSPRNNVNFFDLGGHSLLVPKLHAKMKDAFPDARIRLLDLFTKSTVKSQATLLQKTQRTMQPAKPVQKPVPEHDTSMTKDSSVSTTKDLAKGPYSDDSRSSLQNGFAGVQTTEHIQGQTSTAVIGMAGRFPGASNVDDFYAELRRGYLAIVDSGVKCKQGLLPGNLWVSKAGFLSDVEDFDPGFWNISREAATEMDPQQRLFLEVAFEALHDAGIDPRHDERTGRKIGLFVGAANPTYHMHTESVLTDNFLKQNRGFVMPSISALTAYHLNLTGPNVTVQNNCASGTVALSLAVDAIRAGRCDYAVVGGVSVQLYEGGYTTQNGVENGQIFSPRGICSPWDSSADGTVPGDAVTAFVLSRYDLAATTETPIYAKILGTGIGSDGGLDKVGFQVPSPRGQAEVMKSAWKQSGAAIARLRYAEVHGSGTPIGDALELEGLSLAATELGERRQPLVIGSVKGSIGNSQHASGLVSLAKLCKSIQHGIIPATHGLKEPNAMIDPTLPVQLAMQETELGAEDLLAVSATGWGGVNSHMVLEMPPPQLRKKQTRALPVDCFARERLQSPRFHVNGTDSGGNDDKHDVEGNGHVNGMIIRKAPGALEISP